MAIAAAKRLPTSPGLLGTVAVAKDPGNLPGSLFKPPEVDELALLDRFSAFVPRGWKR